MGLPARLVVLSAVALLGCGRDAPIGPDPDPPPPTVGPHDRDLDALESWLGLEASWPPGRRDEAERRISQHRALEVALGDAPFFLAAAEIVALADNAHTNMSRAAVFNRYGLLPLRFFWFADGPHVVRATTEHARLLGAELLRVAGLTPEAWVERMGTYHGGPPEHFKAFYLNSLGLSPALLAAAGVTDDPRRVTLELGLPDGLVEEVVVETHTGQHPFGSPWRYLSPDPLGGENGGWVSARQGAGVPWALQDPGSAFRYRYLPEEDVAHIQLRSNTDAGGASIAAFVTQVPRLLERDRPRHIILDNRDNPGGDLGSTADFALSLPDAVEGMVVSLTSHATFSAGIYTAFYPEAAAPDRTVVLGARVGDRERFFAEEGAPFRLPDSGHQIRYARLAHDLGAGCSGAPCFLLPDRHRIAVGSLDPEVEAGLTFADYAEGIDTDVALALSMITG